MKVNKLLMFFAVLSLFTTTSWGEIIFPKNGSEVNIGTHKSISWETTGVDSQYMKVYYYNNEGKKVRYYYDYINTHGDGTYELDYTFSNFPHKLYIEINGYKNKEHIRRFKSVVNVTDNSTSNNPAKLTNFKIKEIEEGVALLSWDADSDNIDKITIKSSEQSWTLTDKEINDRSSYLQFLEDGKKYTLNFLITYNGKVVENSETFTFTKKDFSTEEDMKLYFTSPVDNETFKLGDTIKVNWNLEGTLDKKTQYVSFNAYYTNNEGKWESLYKYNKDVTVQNSEQFTFDKSNNIDVSKGINVELFVFDNSENKAILSQTIHINLVDDVQREFGIIAPDYDVARPEQDKLIRWNSTGTDKQQIKIYIKDYHGEKLRLFYGYVTGTEEYKLDLSHDIRGNVVDLIGYEVIIELNGYKDDKYIKRDKKVLLVE